MEATLYDSLQRVADDVETLANPSGERENIAALVSGLRDHVAAYRAATRRQELALLRGDTEAFERAEADAKASREAMLGLTRVSLEKGEGLVTDEIDALRVATQGTAAMSLFFSALAIAIGLVAGYGLTRTIHRPVKELRVATEALSRGEFDLRVPAHRRDELGDLARAFNEMAARLHELDEMKSHFVSVVSHELKTPLTSMRDAVELLAEGVAGDLTPRQKRLLAITREGMERLVSYVEGILDLTRFEAGQVRLVREPVSLNTVVGEQADLVRKSCWERDIELNIDLDDDLPLVEGDRLRLGQVVANLLSNAVQFTPPGGRITVSGLVRPWQDDIGVCLEVRDTGPGIDPRDRAHIFERFFQGAGAGGQHVQGAGIGLAVVKNLVEAHDGVVEVVSRPRQGTVFRVIFPGARRSHPAFAGGEQVAVR
ncbi:MAG: ATP-binding protein [Acidobacteriota bacterium]